MPIPKPHKGEKRDDFHSRCMADDTMNSDYKDQAQRNAICYRSWDDAHPENPHPQQATWLPETAACWSNHLGFWCIEPFWFGRAVTAYKEGLWQPRRSTRSQSLFDGFLSPEQVRALEEGEIPIMAAERRGYEVTKQGTAIIPLMGPLTKAGSYKFDGTSSVRTRRALRMAATDEEVGNILLHIDSPGGHVAGIEALAGEVASLRGRKPIVAHIDDLGASAAYWVASQADAIYANATSEIGSLGTIAVVEDTSGRMDRLGVKVHVISTGPYKGVGVEGAPLSDTALAYLKERIDAINGHFMTAVRTGRRYTDEQLAQVSDGRVHIASTAQSLGLIDRVQSLDETIAQLVTSPGPPAGGRFRPTRAQTDALLAAAEARFTVGGGIDAHLS